MKTVNIKGKEYVTVNERVKYFNENYSNGKIEVSFVELNNDKAVMRAIVTPDCDKPDRCFTGHAYEVADSSFINKTSYIENCETSAVGRALGLMGIGTDESIGSADEVANAMANQKQTAEKLTDKQKDTIVNFMTEGKVHANDLQERYGTAKVDSLSKSQASELIGYVYNKTGGEK